MDNLKTRTLRKIYSTEHITEISVVQVNKLNPRLKLLLALAKPETLYQWMNRRKIRPEKLVTIKPDHYEKSLLVFVKDDKGIQLMY